MLARMITAFVMIATAVAIFPVVSNTIQEAQQNITSTPSPISEQMVQMLNWMPWLFAGGILLIAIMVIFNALRSGGLTDDDYVPMKGDYNDEDDEDEESDENEDEPDNTTTPPKEEKKKIHRTVVTTTKKTGERKMNVTVGPGYNVDKYALDAPSDTKLTMKEKEFTKTRFD
jgi:magnesium-transporting ATPase (P-type)